MTRAVMLCGVRSSDPTPKHRRETSPRVLWAAALGLLVFVGLVAWLVAVHLSATPDQRLVDLDVYRDAGRSILDGRDVYAHVGHAPQFLPFTYPPFAAVVSIPFAWVPFMVAAWSWTMVELALTVLITWLGFRRLLPRFGPWWPLALGALAGAMQQMLPLRDEVKFGQVDELMVALCAVDCLLVVGRSRRWGGLLIGVATAIKLTPGVFVVYLFVSGRRRAAGTALAAFVGIGLLTAVALPGDSDRFWTDAVFHSDRLRPNDNTSNQALRGMWLRVGLDHHTTTALWVVSLVVVAALGFRRAAVAHRGGDELTAVAITGLLAVALSPVAWIHHLAWLPLVLGAIAADGRSRARLLAGAAVYLFFVVKVPWIGHHVVTHGGPVAAGRLLEDGYGLAVLAIIVMMRPYLPQLVEERFAAHAGAERHSASH